MSENPRRLLERYGLHPRKSLGQNFLVDPDAPTRIAEQADLRPEDTVIEVGAGLGTLTVALAERAGRVLAVEADEEMVAVLHRELADRRNIEIIHGDILELDPVVLLGGKSRRADSEPYPLWVLLPPPIVLSDDPDLFPEIVLEV